MEKKIFHKVAELNYNFLSITHPDPDQDVGTSPLLSNHTCPVMFCSPWKYLEGISLVWCSDFNILNHVCSTEMLQKHSDHCIPWYWSVQNHTNKDA